MSLSPPSTFLCVAWSCTVVDKNAHTVGAIHPLLISSPKRDLDKKSAFSFLYETYVQNVPAGKLEDILINKVKHKEINFAVYTGKQDTEINAPWGISVMGQFIERSIVKGMHSIVQGTHHPRNKYSGTHRSGTEVKDQKIYYDMMVFRWSVGPAKTR